MKDLLLQSFRFDPMSGFVGIFVGFFTVLTLVYSAAYMRGRPGLQRYYWYVLLTALASLGAVFSNNLVLFAVFWGILGLLLYLLIGLGGTERASYTAKKAFIIIGGTDAFMLLGLALVWLLSGRPSLLEFNMDMVRLSFVTRAATVAYLCLATAALAKAGCMPFHTWVPDMAEDAPVPATAFLPASLDKLLGIYFLARLSLEMFRMNLGMSTLLMAVGSITIVAAVMMALVQHDLKRLLGYHAVSQVGYMVLGIGTGNPIGIAGGLFHMLNNTIYKSCLFFAGGAAEKEAGSTELGRLGGLARLMPVTFISFLVAALAISGVPPLNGFASKWMIYQGVLGTHATGGWGLWIIWLAAAMFGSALTLASFMKLLHAVFLGQPSPKSKARGETSALMWIPCVILASLCVLFGVFAYHLPLRQIIFPIFGKEIWGPGEWHPLTAAALLVAGLGAGVVIYLLGTALKTRETEPFVGGEILSEHPGMRMAGVDFYRTVQEMGFLRTIYRMAEGKWFDVYEVGKGLCFGISKALGALHNGRLPNYLAWCLLGMAVLFYVLLR